MPLTLTQHTTSAVPIEVEGVLPERIAELSPGEIERLPVLHGNRRTPLGEFFRAAGDASDLQLEWVGDLSGVHRIGAGMTTGRIRVDGCAGRHLGSAMTGGEIIVAGDAGDWLGAEMRGGAVHVHGDAGDCVGAAYRGARRGMAGGTIFIHGRAGHELGHSMRRGLIAVAGDAGEFAGFHMLAGSIFVFGRVGLRCGAEMRRGTIALLGPHAPALLPTFRFACRFRPPMLPLQLAGLRRAGL
ncbi:MAG: formylmethanofuran dehydrogenase subunit C, partial [Planctomycetales bacterium]|nr:formylmethanofuran dehydrogenase subunit C [Planctomycetales bacterium]